METKQLNNYKITFYSKESFIGCKYNNKANIIVFSGLVSMIPEVLADKIVESELYEDDFNTFTSIGTRVLLYKNYIANDFSFGTAKQSFQTLSNLSYCVITKI